MSNDYFNYGVLLPAGIARAGDVDSRFQAVETAFGYLPSRATLGLVIKPIVTAGGTANALTVTNATPLASYTEGQRITFKASASNTTAATINADGLGAKAIKRADGTTVSAGDIITGTIYDVVYNSGGSGYFQFVAATVGELATYAASASASASSASTSAGTATTKASEASTSAAAGLVSQNAAAASATTASGAATTATTKAGEAASSASTASGAATTATTKAGEAAASAATATTKASDAAASAATATTKASDAAASAATATTKASDAANSASTAATLVAQIPDATGQPAGVYLSWNGSTWTYTTPSGILPAISAGTASKWLTNNGTAASWATLGSLAAKSTVNNGDWSGTALAVANGGTGATTASAARTALGLVIGTDVQAQNANLAAMAGVTSAADKLFYFTGSGTGAVATLSTFARTFLDDADAATVRTTIGAAASSTALTALGSVTPAIGKAPYFDSSTTAATYDITAAGRSLVGQNDTASMRSALGLVIGTDVQALNAKLTAFSGLTGAANKLGYFTGVSTMAVTDLTATGIAVIGAASASAVRTAIGTVIGTDVQAFSANLGALAGLTSAADKLPYFTGSGTAATTTLSSFIRTLLDDADAATARATLGVSAGWTQIDIKTPSAAANATFTAIPQTYSELLVAFEFVKFTAAGSLYCYLSTNGTSEIQFTVSNSLSGTSTDEYIGELSLRRYTGVSGTLVGIIGKCATNTSPDGTLGSQNTFQGWRIAGGVGNIQIAPAGGTMTGTLRLFGR